MLQSISVERTTTPKPKPQANELGFGKYFTDHMFIMEYEPDPGWHRPRIVPYQPISLDPSAKTFHYGQTVFEGLKAYRTAEQKIQIFRPRMNIRRLNLSNERLCIPPLHEKTVLEALMQLLRIDRDWIPFEPGTSLYIRPFVIATEPALGVAPSRHYRFIIILSPVGAYYSEGVHPISIHVESRYVRAVAGGVGNAKTGGNYAASLKSQEEASRRGCAQVLWLDGTYRKYVEEVGSMNVFFRIEDTVVTPALTGSFLEGVIRDSVIRILDHWNIAVQERPISIDEVVRAHRAGSLKEIFGTGTAAVISPVGELHWQGEKLTVGDGTAGALSAKLYDTLTGIQTGRLPDPFEWMEEVGD
ncbi:branched-chain amino acid aminotransferase [Cohnella caldifontis]|uniref:branched-chain amino acid aminotransferase n=1 Tax=Cohnella caldifontis TaxID=3027471 RepID=UPI0023ED578A|nr:branched-chain amino acid aminotransferase [Cohnella sp. YIM B05605]